MSDKDKLLAAALKRLEQLKLDKCFDPFDLESVPTSQQDEIFRDINKVQYRWVVAGNRSGKSALAARELTWVLQNNHPYWKRPEKWGSKPLMCLVAGKSRQGLEEELWNKKLKPFLNPADWKPIRAGNVLQSVRHRETGDTIVFLTHADSSERVINNLQMYTADYVWVDEMPMKYKVLEELQRRTDTTGGPFIATFTPKTVNIETKRMVDAAKEPVAKRYRLSKLDNPVFAATKDIEIAKLEGLPQAMKNTILYGDWSAGDTQVYKFDYDTCVSELPSTYNKGWRHVESLDPALQSKMGYTLWAEDPATDIWYCIQDEYVENVYVPTKLVDTMKEKTKGYNITRRIADTHESWYINQASEMGLTYLAPYKKSERKGEMIKNLQQALGIKIKIAPWCERLVEEFQTCRWSENAENKIVNSSSFHLLDSAQYFVDLMPQATQERPAGSHAEWLRQANEARKKAEKKAAKINSSHRKSYKIKKSKRWI